MIRILPFLFALSTAIASVAQSPQRIVYKWMNVPCGDMLHCDAGCSACNLPETGTGTGLLMGTNMAWIGVSTCPHPIALGDNAVMTTGWSAAPGNDQYIIFSGIATVPLRIDSLVISHASATNGPERLKVDFTANAAAALEEVADEAVQQTFEDLILTNLGTIEIPEGSSLGTFQVKLTAYQGWGAGWALNEIRVVTTPVASDNAMGITDLGQRTSTSAGPWFDVMGRPINREPAPGVYVGPSKTVRLF